jgi:DNA-binding response OmpR family regulator
MSYILIVDDDDAVRGMLQMFFTRNGYTVKVAEDGAEGERCVQAEMPTLLITDIMMPNEDGMELLMNLRDKAPDLPVIAISGGSRGFSYDPLPVAKKLGARCVFSKPLDPQELLAAVKELIPA